MHAKIVFIILYTFVIASFLTAQTDSQTSSFSMPNFKSIGSSIEGMGSGLAKGFGYCPSDNQYSMITINDLSQPLFIAVQAFVSIQGEAFPGTPKEHTTIQPFSISDKNDLSDIHVCSARIYLDTGGDQKIPWWTSAGQDIVNLLTFGFGASLVKSPLDTHAIYTRDIDTDPKEKDTTYYYHAFTIQNKPNGEFMGPGMYGGPFTMTDQFDGTFFNNTTDQIELTFVKNKKVYNVNLDPQSFAILRSDDEKPNSIRAPNAAFTFKLPNKVVAIPIASTGAANISKDPKTNETKNIPVTMRYEIYDGQVGIQGFNIGNYNQLGMMEVSSKQTPPAPTNIRDINPIECNIWVQSIKEAQAEQQSDNNLIPYQLPGALWAAYTSSDMNIQQQLSPGVTTIHIIRPPLKDKKANLYIFSLNTNDPTKAKQFLANVSGKQNLAQTVINLPLATNLTLTDNDIEKLLGAASSKTGQNAVITDAKSGVQGTLLFVDTFIPYGGGQEASPHYYMIPPSYLVSGASSLSFASIITSLLDLTQFDSNNKTSQATAQKDFWNNITQWLTTFNGNQKLLTGKTITPQTAQQNAALLQQLVPELTQYLKTNGLKTLFSNPDAQPATRRFNPAGIRALYTILFGPISLNNPPLLTSAGNNVGIGGKKPDGWPS